MAFRLPPLSSLRVFEAAARHKSFRKAADELNLTASAVSHGIQTLENWLGVELFHRQSRGLRLTGAGEIYAPLVNQALSLIAKATEQLPGRKATGTLSLSSAPTFANKILLPRLEKFAAQHPDIRVTIDTSLRPVDLTLDDFDIAIRFSTTKKPAPNWTLLAVETLLPVCSPGAEGAVRRFRCEAIGARAADPCHLGADRLAALVSDQRTRGAIVDRWRTSCRHRADGVRCRRARPRRSPGPAAAGRRRYRNRPAGSAGRPVDSERRQLLAGYGADRLSEARGQIIQAMAVVRTRRRHRAA